MGKPLTDLAVKNTQPNGARREVPDGKIGGLFLIVQPSGAKSWALRYRLKEGGTPKKFTIGSYPAITLAVARNRAQKAIGEVADGNDPAAAKQAARAATKAEVQAQSDLVERVVEQFIERHAKVKTRDWRETKRMLDNEIVARWKGRRLSQIGRAQVHEMLDEIIERGAPVRANRVFAQGRKMCNWAVDRGIIDRNPFEGLTAPTIETKRERVLSDDEIRLAWRAFEEIGWPFGPIGKLLLLTGARRNEVSEMRWSEVRLDERLWILPAARAKNKREHSLPLTDAAVAILKGLPRIVDGKGGLIFTTTGETPVSGFSRAKTAIDKAMIKAMRKEAGAEDMTGPEPWTLHDIRRTVATGLQRLGVRLEVTEAVLNHVSGSRAGIVGVYQRHEYAAEKRSAMEAWGRYLDGLVSRAPTGNVVQLAAARG